MSRHIFQFRVEHLFVVITLVATLLTMVALSRSFYELKGARGIPDSTHLAMFLLPAMVGFCFRRIRLPSLLAIVFVCLFFGIRQVTLGRQLQTLRQEVTRVVAYVENYKVERGRFPADLSGFKYQRPEFQKQIEFGLDPDGTSYYLWFNPAGEPNVGHYYYSTYGFWREWEPPPDPLPQDTSTAPAPP